MTIQTLTTEDVLKIHEILVRDFAQSDDPIFPPGVKDLNLLESAVSRQHVGFGGREKYRTAYAAAATLTYGVCNNHSFHNGNKRTALVAMLAHLDKNDLSFGSVPQADLYKMIIALADHRIVSLVKGGKAPAKTDADEDVAALTAWLEKRAKKPQRGEKQITYRELRRILNRFDFDLAVPASGKGNHRDLIKRETRTTGLLRKRTEAIEKRIGSIGYRDEGTFVALGDLKRVRMICGLRVEDGVDSGRFYDDDAVIDSFISRYRTILRKLARK
jgi:death-on-curing family protein